MWSLKQKEKKKKNNKPPKWTHGYRKQVGGCQRQEVGLQVGDMSESGPQVQASSVSPGEVRHSMVSLVKIPYWIFEHC